MRTNNSALQSALMANAQKLALMGDAESLKKDLENERTKRFGMKKTYSHQHHIFLDLDTQCKSLTEQVGVITAARDAALAENATLSANIAQLEVNLIFFLYVYIILSNRHPNHHHQT